MCGLPWDPDSNKPTLKKCFWLNTATIWCYGVIVNFVGCDRESEVVYNYLLACNAYSNVYGWNDEISGTSFNTPGKQ